MTPLTGTSLRDPSSAARTLQGGSEICGQRRREIHRLAGKGMPEREPCRVEELAREAELTRSAVHRVTRDREVDGGEVDADLMRAAGLEADAQERVARQELLELEMRHRGTGCGGVERLAEPVVPVAADRCLDGPAARPRPAGAGLR